MSDEEYEAEIPTGTERILFVDDELPNTMIAKQLLSRLGYEITTRTSSLEALELFTARHDQFDLLITDQTMPQMTGQELLNAVRFIRPELPIVLFATVFLKRSRRATTARWDSTGI